VPIQTGLGDDDSIRAVHEVTILGNIRRAIFEVSADEGPGNPV
jgi:hypothetical protein